jgi:hypothetical protein
MIRRLCKAILLLFVWLLLVGLLPHRASIAVENLLTLFILWCAFPRLVATVDRIRLVPRLRRVRGGGLLR